ncbi:thioredoxin domain-containing protein [Spirulina major CS-329]|uniref:thioredoxin domain-containing protein n=1 Tax=Spirulina TaxID=1154 RepID=UPI00232D68B7|nr:MULTISPECIES: thioredoxin domain-containing protein [Spirulina]MDB9496221.1 thioredoxin domain-containing protein [Spirulina subsalsa CS-330]MDB9504267.1 thioredoxin domain-containing protein [Spirulina major CS-329]
MSNRLAHSQSLYLRKHADNPIDWWPWCEEALTTARQEDKPIFLSIGYSSCHWCTVMEGEAFSDGAIAALMNENFLPIKVDREERPDIDSIYMQALQMMTGQGGWPLNIWLTPSDRIPFYGGTYFPVEARYGRPAFLDLLHALLAFYRDDKEKLSTVTGRIFNALKKSTLLPTTNTPLTTELLHHGITTCTRILQNSPPGTPSFPMIPYAAVVASGSRLEGQGDAIAAAQNRGNAIALGGICDHVAGGFHRYTVDATWTVPHFEKMLYDNGQILEYLANLWSSGHQDPAYRRAIQGAIAWLAREMTAPEGYFYAAQDADSFRTPDDAEPEEGAFYVWSYADLEQILTPEELTSLAAQFTITPAGNFEGLNVLQRLDGGELSPSVEAALTKLFTVRYGATPDHVATFPPAADNHAAKTHPWPGRIPAVTDTKMIAAWNSLMISGLARVAAVFEDEQAWLLAIEAMGFLLRSQWLDGQFYRLNYNGVASVLAQAEDYALTIKALLDLYQVRQEEDWKTAAIALQAEFDRALWCAESGGYFNAVGANQDLIIRERSYIDNATPAANGVAVANLVRLAVLTEETRYLDRAEQGLLAFSGVLQEMPSACPSLFGALDWWLYGTTVRSRPEQLHDLNRQFWPVAMYRLDTELPEAAIALVCKGLTCLPASITPDALNRQLRQCHGIPG